MNCSDQSKKSWINFLFHCNMKRGQESIHWSTNFNSTEARSRASVEWGLTGLISSSKFVIQWLARNEMVILSWYFLLITLLAVHYVLYSLIPWRLTSVYAGFNCTELTSVTRILLYITIYNEKLEPSYWILRTYINYIIMYTLPNII